MDLESQGNILTREDSGTPSKSASLAKYKKANTNVAKPKTGKLFVGDRGFDPITIIMQIVALQLCYYTSLSLCIIIVDFCCGLRPHLAQIFSSGSLDLGAERYGYATLFANVLNIGFVVLAEAHIVEKAIKCLDFTLTLVFYHIVIMGLTYGWPGWKLNWWISQAVIVTLTCIFSEMLCMKLETQEIKLSVDDLI